MKKVAVIGATGRLASVVINEMLEKGILVKALVRNIEKAKKLLPSEVEIIEADATKQSIINILDTKTFDIIIDDGSHMTQDQIGTFNLLKGKMNKGFGQ
jgi:uncharacterized protein YbjT (DUF2867 family)